MTPTQPLLATKPRYEILDGLRGVAALLVVAFHLLESYSRGPAFQIINHGYLAVDFFFALSGFVIGYAYDDRWNRMSVWQFFKRRLVRLHPMVIMGSAVGALLFYFGACDTFPLIGQTPWWKLLLLFLLGCTMLPALTAWDIRGWQETNPLNGPTWSLLWEYVANILYALFIRRLSKTLLFLFVVGTAVLTLDLALNIDLFGLLGDRQDAAYTVIGGWSITPTQIYIGFTRVLYPFFGGLLLSRIGKVIRIRGGFWFCSLAVTVLLAMPHLGGTEAPWLNGAYNATCILLLFPLVIATGAGSRLTDRRSAAICELLGSISYPLYITHYPLVYMQMAWIAQHPDAPAGMHACVSVSTYLLAVGLAYACLRLYDLPVRAWLQRRLLGQK